MERENNERLPGIDSRYQLFTITRAKDLNELQAWLTAAASEVTRLRKLRNQLAVKSLAEGRPYEWSLDQEFMEFLRFVEIVSYQVKKLLDGPPMKTLVVKVPVPVMPVPSSN